MNLKDPTSRQLEQEEHNFYGETQEDLEREQRRREAEDQEFDIWQDDHYDNYHNNN